MKFTHLTMIELELELKPMGSSANGSKLQILPMDELKELLESARTSEKQDSTSFIRETLL